MISTIFTKGKKEKARNYQQSTLTNLMVFCNDVTVLVSGG